jgi:hypothetical protein
MCDLNGFTSTELDNMTKEQLIGEALKNVRITSTTLAHDEKGNAVRLDETTTDPYGALLNRRSVEWSYFKTGGEVNEIVVTSMDAKGKIESQYKVKHYRTGRQPELVEIVSAKPIER